MLRFPGIDDSEDNWCSEVRVSAMMDVETSFVRGWEIADLQRERLSMRPFHVGLVSDVLHVEIPKPQHQAVRRLDRSGTKSGTICKSTSMSFHEVASVLCKMLLVMEE